MKRVEKEIDRTIRDARDKEKRQRRKPPAEDKVPVRPIIIKSLSRRYERPKS